MGMTITDWFLVILLVFALLMVGLGLIFNFTKRPQYPPVGSVRGSIKADPDARYQPHRHSEDVGGSTVRLAAFAPKIFPDGPQQTNGSDSAAWKAQN